MIPPTLHPGFYLAAWLLVVAVVFVWAWLDARTDPPTPEERAATRRGCEDGFRRMSRTPNPYTRSKGDTP